MIATRQLVMEGGLSGQPTECRYSVTLHLRDVAMAAPLYGGRPRPRRHCVMVTQLLPPKKGKHSNPPTFWPISVVAHQSPISATAELLSVFTVRRYASTVYAVHLSV